MPVTPPRRYPRVQPKAPRRVSRVGGNLRPGGVSNTSVLSPNIQFNPVASTAGAATMGAQAAGPTAPDIRDPSYWLDTENIANYYGTTKAQYGEQRRQDELARDRAYELLGLGRSGTDTLDPNKLYGAGGLKHEGTYYNDISAARTSANKAGLYYSGILGQNLGDIQKSAVRQQGAIGEEFTGRENLRKIAEASLDTEYAPGGIKYREATEAARQRAIDWAERHPPAPAPIYTRENPGPYKATRTKTGKASIAPGWGIRNGKFVRLS